MGGQGVEEGTPHYRGGCGMQNEAGVADSPNHPPTHKRMDLAGLRGRKRRGVGGGVYKWAGGGGEERGARG